MGMTQAREPDGDGRIARRRGGEPYAIARPMLQPLAISSPTSFFLSLASQDWLIIGYYVALLLALVMGSGHGRGACIIRVSADLGAFLFVLALVRLQVLRWGGAAASLLYRTAMVAAPL